MAGHVYTYYCICINACVCLFNPACGCQISNLHVIEHVCKWNMYMIVTEANIILNLMIYSHMFNPLYIITQHAHNLEILSLSCTGWQKSRTTPCFKIPNFWQQKITYKEIIGLHITCKCSMRSSSSNSAMYINYSTLLYMEMVTWKVAVIQKYIL